MGQTDGRRIFKANSITFCCCRFVDSVGWLLPLAATASSCYLFQFFVFFYLFWFFRFFAFVVTWNSQMNFAWKQNHMQSRAGNKAQSAKGAQRTSRKGWAEQRTGSGLCLRLCASVQSGLRKCISFWYFFARKLKWDLFITFSFCRPTVHPATHSCHNIHIYI